MDTEAAVQVQGWTILKIFKMAGATMTTVLVLLVGRRMRGTLLAVDKSAGHTTVALGARSEGTRE